MKRIAVLVTLVGGLVAASVAPASATDPALGQWRGEGVGFHVAHTQHGTAYVSSAHWHAQTAFHRADIHDRTFETCARHRISAVLARDTCLVGHFTSQHEAQGTTRIYQVAHGHRASHPSETHHWSATVSG
ncbi:hypothetical protein ABLE68_00820 [Nocardioides sp. CN2-186]|uniref:hypothetical protein n=1 Tax=Nocardioides tweenelious TaxID=3156607 RepID=UPI0032B5EED7